MSDPQEELKRWFHDKTAPHGIKSKLSDVSGYSPTQISRMRNIETDDPKKRQEIPLDMIAKAARFFNELPPGFDGMTQWLDDDAPKVSGPDIVPIMGYLGAGAEVEPDHEQVPPEGLEQYEVPFPLPEEMVAFKVRGTSMLPVFKPDAVIIVYRHQKKPIDSFYGEEAAVRTSDGRRFIKTIIRGSVKGRVNLISWNDVAPIENVSLDWVGEIFAVLPPSAIKKVARQGGIQGRLSLGSGTHG